MKWILIPAAACWLVWTLMGGLTAPDSAQIRAVCRHHNGVAAVGAKYIIGPTPITCRDGWMEYR